jgi:thiol-disulfide isomerase/thioredoxin
LKIAGAIVLVLASFWVGMRVRSLHGPAVHATVPSDRAPQKVPAGEASPPTARDFAADFDPAMPPVPKIPERLPAFTLSDLNGKATPIAKWSGKSLVLNFWATWCAPCRREMPLLKSLSVAWRARDVEVVGVAVDYRDKVASYTDELKIPYPILVGEEDALDVASQLGMNTAVFPFTVFTDRRGEVVTLYLGELHQAQADLILGVVQHVNDHDFDLAEARRTITLGLKALKTDG